jgi:AcrR family transcriptional regulator
MSAKPSMDVVWTAEHGAVPASTEPDRAGVEPEPEPGTRRPGRPRSEQADKSIIEATLRLLADTMSVSALSVETVAAHAKVGKATIYRRWPNKEALVIDALKALHPTPTDALPGTSVRDDLIVLLDSMQSVVDSTVAGRLFSCMLVEYERNPALVKGYREQVLEPRREQVRQVLRHGVETGELRPDTDVETAMNCLTSLAIRSKLESRFEPYNRETVEKTVDTVLNGIAAR